MAELTAELRTRHLPPIVIGEGEGEPGAGSWLLSVLRPRLSVRLYGREVMARAPWGEPGETTWPLLGILAAVGTLFVVVTMARGIVRGR